MPKRIQRKRTRGWTMPENAVYVGRPTKWGNPYRLHEDRRNVVTGAPVVVFDSNILQLYEQWILQQVRLGANDLRELRGKDLACWCREGAPCHGDVLLRLSNPQED